MAIVSASPALTTTPVQIASGINAGPGSPVQVRFSCPAATFLGSSASNCTYPVGANTEVVLLLGQGDVLFAATQATTNTGQTLISHQ
jgi:hypothetical protein